MSTREFRFAEVFSYESLVHAMAGAVGSVTAMTVFFPLDTARLRLQVDEKRKARSTPAILSEIVKEEGVAGALQGLAPSDLQSLLLQLRLLLLLPQPESQLAPGTQVNSKQRPAIGHRCRCLCADH